MFARALIVLLLVLNLGVATWWVLRPPASPPPPSEMRANAPRLQLLSEVSQPARAAKAVSTPAAIPEPAAVATTAAAQHCIAFGPFTDAAMLTRASATLRPQVTRLQVREAPASGHGWRVWLPPLTDHGAAQAMAARIAAAGFQDYYIVPGGDEANSIALGRYGNEAAAQRQQSALQAAGFPAQSEALGGTARWIDVMVTAAFDADSVRSHIGAPQVQSLDCAKLH